MKVMVHTERVSSRVRYIFNHIFKRILHSEIQFTTDVSEFVAFDGFKLSYGSKPLAKEFHVGSCGLLYESGCHGQEIQFSEWEELPTFFPVGQSSHIPFDLFAASFYLISRYEEYLPHREDELGRFVPKDSVAHNGQFLDSPIVDLWAFKLAEKLSDYFNAVAYRTQHAHIHVCIEVKTAFKYLEKGVIDTIGFMGGAFLRLRLRTFLDQIRILLKLKPDPHDIYDRIINMLHAHDKDKRIKKKHVTFFFHLGDYSPVDRGTSWLSRRYRETIKHIGDHADLGLRFSFRNSSMEAISEETKRFEQVTQRPLVRTKTARSKIAMPGHYRNLVDISSLEDYSMGYPNATGFRASTATPFYYYDLDFEVQTPLKVVPYAIHSEALGDMQERQMLLQVKSLLKPVKRVGGHFVTLIRHEDLCSENREAYFTLIQKLLDAEI